jgi:hypothetical protein
VHLQQQHDDLAIVVGFTCVVLLSGLCTVWCCLNLGRPVKRPDSSADQDDFPVCSTPDTARQSVRAWLGGEVEAARVAIHIRALEEGATAKAEAQEAKATAEAEVPIPPP